MCKLGRNILAILAATAPLSAADPFAENIRTTPWLEPDAQQKTFRLPPGFEIQLFASEPDIAKPMNMAFDARGRLWVTATVEYPFPVGLDQRGRDSIMILEDTDGDGRADKVTRFAEGLNIPLGIYPFGRGAICWSIPHIWWLDDADGDGRAERQERLYGPLGWERDTHGNNSSFTRGFDGWLYATHGFNNLTTVRGRDGHEISMQSGSTYRMRLDGARIENFTWGQVNPFGLCFDAYGNLYAADCHSEPLYQLVRGAHYPSFGKPHDGLGFGPSMIFHGHGSTAISGIVYYEDDPWPEEYRHNLFTGNVMTSRVNRDAVVFKGATPLAEERPDFVVSDDPWFRPVNLQLGPDGALYIADFYNRIIGHYEVPLTHPGRDRESGRIWRVVYRGGNSKGARPFRPLDQASPEALVAELSSPNLTRRQLATDQLTDRVGANATGALAVALTGTALQKSHGLWALHRLGTLRDSDWARAASDPVPLVRVHAFRVLAELRSWTEGQAAAAREVLLDPDPRVQRAAAEAFGLRNNHEGIEALLQLRHRVPSEDTHLLHTVRIALRNQLRSGGSFPAIAARDVAAVADVCLGIQSAEAAVFLLRHLEALGTEPQALARALQHAARFAPASEMGRIAEFAQSHFEDLDAQLALLESVQRGAEQAGAALSEPVLQWARALAGKLLASVDPGSRSWTSLPLKEEGRPVIPWTWESRTASDGRRGMFLSSFPKGEQATGRFRSAPFDIPREFRFFMAGQSGFPGRPDPIRNWFRLRAADTDEVLKEAPVPRNDVAQETVWELSAHAGKRGYLEAEDRDDGTSWAWMAFARFDPPVVPLPELDPATAQARQQAALKIVLALAKLSPALTKSLALEEARAEVQETAEAATTDPATRGDAVKTLAAFDEALAVRTGLAILQNPVETAVARASVAQALAELNSPAALDALADQLTRVSSQLQIRLALAMASRPESAERLLDAIAAGKASPRLLSDRGLRNRLNMAKPPRWEARLAELTQGLVPLDEQIQQQMDSRRAAFLAAPGSKEQGAAVFAESCGICHQIDGQGAVVGPQLDGIGNRGLDRVLEDLLDPNRNVDVAFRSHLFVLSDGDVVSGLPRREEGEVIVVVDATGKELQLPKSEITQRRESTLSLMPENFGDVLSNEAMSDLLAYLLAQRAPAAPPR